MSEGDEKPWSRRATLGGLGAAAGLLGLAATAGPAGAAPPHPALHPPEYGVDVRRLGARGDGTTDDTAAFRRAFDAAAAGGHLVIVPPGTYRIAAPLHAIAPIHLVGLAGEAGSKIVFDAGLDSGLTITQASTEEPYPGPAIELSGLWFEYAGTGPAVQITEDGVRAPFHDTRITGCRFHVGTGATGFASTNQRSIIVAHNQFLGKGIGKGTGLSVNDSDNTMIANNVFYGLQYGIHGIRGVNRVYNAGCTVMGNSMSGFEKCMFFENWESLQLVGNMLDGASVNCAHLLDCYNSMLSDNYFGPTGTGSALLIETANPRGGRGQIVCSANFINHYGKTSGDAPIAIFGANDGIPVDQVTVVNNIINMYPAVGIHLRNARNVLVNGNTLARAASTATGVRAVYDETPGANHIINNIVDADIDADGDTVTGNFQRS